MENVLLILMALALLFFGKIVGLVGMFLHNKNSYRKAIRCFEIADTMGFSNEYDLLIFYSYLDLNDYPAALKVLERRRIMVGENKDDDLARMYSFLGYLASLDLDLQKSLDYHNKACPFCQTSEVETTVFAGILKIFQVIPLTIVVELKDADDEEQLLQKARDVIEVEFEKVPFLRKS